MNIGSAIVFAVIVLAGCAGTPVVDEPVLQAPFQAGDEAVYAIDFNGSALLVRMRLVPEAPDVLRWEKVWEHDGQLLAADFQWIDGQGAVLATVTSSGTVWYDRPCAAAWLRIAAATCSGWEESVRPDGSTATWRPVQAGREPGQPVDVVIPWGGSDVPVQHWRLAETFNMGGGSSGPNLLEWWVGDLSCFPLRIVNDLDDELVVSTLSYARCGDQIVGEPPASPTPSVPDARLPAPDRQPWARCDGALGLNVNATAYEPSFDCGIFDAFTLFWLAPGQGITVTAAWSGPATAGMRLEVDGLEVPGTVSPLEISMEGFSVPLDQVVIRLHEDGVSVDPTGPNSTRPVNITLTGFAIG